ncbi:MAG: hypothetical protein AAF566_02150 [Pseudomonadota bacterium]
MKKAIPGPHWMVDHERVTGAAAAPSSASWTEALGESWFPEIWA